MPFFVTASILLSQAVGPGYVGRPSYPFYICLNDPSTYVNIRERPTTRSRSYGKLRHGLGVRILSRGAGPDDGMWWSKVYTATNMTGYVRDDYVCAN